MVLLQNHLNISLFPYKICLNMLPYAWDLYISSWVYVLCLSFIDDRFWDQVQQTIACVTCSLADHSPWVSWRHRFLLFLQTIVRTSDIRVSERICLENVTIKKHFTVYNDLLDEVRITLINNFIPLPLNVLLWSIEWFRSGDISLVVEQLANQNTCAANNINIGKNKWIIFFTFWIKLILKVTTHRL